MREYNSSRVASMAVKATSDSRLRRLNSRLRLFRLRGGPFPSEAATSLAPHTSASAIHMTAQ